ncbi:hypothetical protein GVY41_07010 [Frigidibacter albus]|uniref:Uncharacterized protein n=1 Tax=Frigidibacter albus TaxID=1465486 RepID=A0A6L8VHL5_9RHOB|nr:hypothetical protein [Frigidibacter albus]MZQ89196.1 hypothetical protein [Frigidibacter albus]NBE30747.1 hypothetical protein [Frigidibacter albus]GGH50823.1 hypothetical protein GCM10011341_14070 [Frigidibacter albus]
MNTRATLALGIATALAASAAMAHHGWSWAETELSELSGTVASASMAPPHPSLEVTAEDGALWQVDLGNPGQTERSGFTGAEEGASIIVLGNRSLDESEMLIKAVRITVDGTDYVMYPDRLGGN